MVAKLFDGNPPEEGDRILYPGCGTGPFIAAVDRYCDENNLSIPYGIGVDSNPELIGVSRERHSSDGVDIQERDYLGNTADLGEFEYVIGNPPYVPIEGLNEGEKRQYKRRFVTATGRFDLYVLFFERSLSLLDEDGRLVFITPEKFEYTETTEPLRQLLAEHHVEEIEHVDEDSFDGYVTYPTITTVANREPSRTRITDRTGNERTVSLPADGSSWAAVVRGGVPDLDTGVTLGDVTKRVSCGVATGRDGVFVVDREEVPAPIEAEGWTYPTTSGKQLRIYDGPESGQVFICPYDEHGRLPAEEELGAYRDWAELHREALEGRSCVRKGRREWYAWHENPPMKDILQAKILCKDVTESPRFWIDETGKVVPRHSVYYLVPGNSVDIHALIEYLNSGEVQAWLEANCQRAANGFLRLQSKVLDGLPVPAELDQNQRTLPGLSSSFNDFE